MRLTSKRVLIIALNTAMQSERDLIRAQAHIKDDANTKESIAFSKRLIEAYKRELEKLKCQ